MSAGLQNVDELLQRLELDLAEYQDLINRLDALTKAALPAGKVHETMIELGAGLFVDAHIPHPETILIDIGLDLHVDMTIPQARQFSERKVEALIRQRDGLISGHRIQA